MKRPFPFSSIPLLLSLTSIVFSPTFAQDSLKTFIGGHHNVSILFNSAIMSGIGGYEPAAGIGITTLKPTPSAVYWNPAGLAFLQRGGIMAEAKPKITYSPDLTNRVNDEIDTELDQSEQLVYEQNDIDYPDFSLSAGQSDEPIASIALALPCGNYCFGMAYYHAFSLKVEMISSGVETRIETNETNPSDNATIFTRTDISLFLDFNSEVITFALGRKLKQNLSAGISLSRINASGSVSGILLPDGVFTRRGVEKAFNDPSTGWTNDFYSSMIGDFDGGSWGIKAGLAYHPTKRLCFDLMGSFNGNVVLTGDMEIIQYLYPPLNIDAKGDEEVFDLNDIENFAQPTETVLADNQPADEITINTPSSISVGGAYRGISLTLTGYTGELSFEYDLARDGNWVTYSRGVKPKFGALLGFDMKYVRLGLGVIIADEVVSGYKDENGEPIEPTLDIPIPRLNLGTGFKIGEDWKIDLLIVGVPETAMKVSATYSFPR